MDLRRRLARSYGLGRTRCGHESPQRPPKEPVERSKDPAASGPSMTSTPTGARLAYGGRIVRVARDEFALSRAPSFRRTSVTG